MAAHIQLRSKVATEHAKTFLGRMLDEDSFDVLVTGDAVVYKPNGQKLCVLRKNVLDPSLFVEADKALDILREHTTNARGTYAGGVRVKGKTHALDPDTGKTMVVHSAVAGYYDREGHRPFCRQTQFTAEEVNLWENGIVPLSQRVGEVFREAVPDRWRAQMDVVEKTSKDFVIRGTPFTTLTINGTVRAAIHYDKGDLKEGFGCITARRRGRYSGHYLCFPEYRVAADIGDLDVLFFDPHEMHGNTAMQKHDENAERISVVYYYREAMMKCGTAAEENERAKRMSGAL